MCGIENLALAGSQQAWRVVIAQSPLALRPALSSVRSAAAPSLFRRHLVVMGLAGAPGAFPGGCEAPSLRSCVGSQHGAVEECGSGSPLMRQHLDPRRSGVVISGAEAMVAARIGLPALWQQLQDDALLADDRLDRLRLAGIARLRDAELAVLSHQQLLGLAAAEGAWRQAGLPPLRQPLRGEAHPPLAEGWRLRAGVVAASALGNLNALLMDTSRPGHRSAPFSLSRWRGNGLGAVLALRFGLQGEQFNLNAASSSGAQALALAARMIAFGELDLALVVGAEPALAPLLLEANRRSGAMALEGPSRPLTADRSGMVPREAAAALILEREDRALARGAAVLARVVACVSGNEAHHMVAPLPGQGLSDQLLQRLHRQLWAAVDGPAPPIDWLCLHATGTRRFDTEELAFVRRAFTPLPWITAMKRCLGHGLGAAGVVEAALIVEGLRRGELPPWPAPLDPALGLPVRPPLSPRPPRSALQLASGMGGVVVMNLLRRA